MPKLSIRVTKIWGALLLFISSLVLMVTPAHASLQARDLDGNGITDAFFDTSLNITWLRNANVNGAQTWANANSWANNYSFGGYDDWRLPTMVDTGTLGCNYSNVGGTDCGYNVQTATSEMAHLWYIELGNKAYCTPGDGVCSVAQTNWGLKNTGDFQNMQSNLYWSGLEYAPNSIYAWDFNTNYGGQNYANKYFHFYAMAVRPGDVTVASVPEPESLVLALTALAGLGLTRRRRGRFFVWHGTWQNYFRGKANSSSAVCQMGLWPSIHSVDVMARPTPT